MPAKVAPARKVSSMKSAESAAALKEYLRQRRVDDLAGAYVSLLGELWIVKDRQAVLEEVLNRNGIAATDAVERFEPGGEFKKRLDVERQEWIRRMIGALFRKGLPAVK
jgi:hypothetical protein